VSALVHALPAEAVAQAFQQGTDGALPLVGERAQIVPGETELLVLGADTPLRARLAAGSQPFGQLAAVGDLGRGVAHARLPVSGGGNSTAWTGPETIRRPGSGEGVPRRWTVVWEGV